MDKICWTFCTNVEFFFPINCWSSVVASVVLPQLCNLHFLLYFGVSNTNHQTVQISKPYWYDARIVEKEGVKNIVNFER